MAKNYRTIPKLTSDELHRFWLNVAPPNGQGCELWTGKIFTGTGYGGFTLEQQFFGAHRVAYFLYYATQPANLMVCHTCDIPQCVAKAHLWLGTNADNQRDASRKGRLASGDSHPARLHPEYLARGEDNPRAKLTEDKIRQIRALQNTGITRTAVGAAFGVSRVLITNIWLRKAWKHVT